jgi:hypothetical protein
MGGKRCEFLHICSEKKFERILAKDTIEKAYLSFWLKNDLDVNAINGLVHELRLRSDCIGNVVLTPVSIISRSSLDKSAAAASFPSFASDSSFSRVRGCMGKATG